MGGGEILNKFRVWTGAYVLLFNFCHGGLEKHPKVNRTVYFLELGRVVHIQRVCLVSICYYRPPGGAIK